MQIQGINQDTSSYETFFNPENIPTLVVLALYVLAVRITIRKVESGEWNQEEYGKLVMVSILLILVFLFIKTYRSL